MNNIGWVLAGIKPSNENLDNEKINELLSKSFLPDCKYKLFLCGEEIEKEGTLEEMESGFEMVKNNVDDFQIGDYGIISKHEEAELLFIATETEIIDEKPDA